MCFYFCRNLELHTSELGNKRKSQVFLFSMRPGDRISGTSKRLFLLWIWDHALIAELSVGSHLDFSQMCIIMFLITGVRCHWLSEWGGDHSWWGQDGWCWAWKTWIPSSRSWAGVSRQRTFHTYPNFLPLLLPLPCLLFPLMLMLDMTALALDIWRIKEREGGKCSIPDVISESVSSSRTRVLNFQERD